MFNRATPHTIHTSPEGWPWRLRRRVPDTAAMPAAGNAAPLGGWRAGDPVADRRFAELGALDLELGGRLPAVRLAYETWGVYDGANAVLVLPALTGDAHVVGASGPGQPTPGW